MKRLAGAILLYVPILVVLFFSGTGCQVTGQGRTSQGVYRNFNYQQINDGAWLTVFLNLKEGAGPQVAMQVSSVEIGAGNTWQPLTATTAIFDTAKIKGGQVFVARNMLLPGEYAKLRITVAEASILENSLKKSLSLIEPSVEMELPAGFSLAKGGSTSVFVTWDVNASLTERDSFKAAMAARPQAIPFLKDLSFIACPELDTVYVISTDKNWVISSFGVEGEPAYLGVDTLLNRIYILARDEFSIMVYDINKNSLVDKYYIAMENRPSYMFLSPDKQFAYLLDEAARGLYKVNLRDGTVDNKVILPFMPAYGFYIQGQNSIALSAADMNSVYVLNPDNLLVVQSFGVGNYPQGLASYQGLLLVAESASNTVSSYDLVDGKQRNRENVGFSPNRLLIKDNQLYSTNVFSNSVTVMYSGQLNAIREIPLGGKPMEMATIKNRFNIYVGNEDAGGVNVIDSASNRVTEFIDLAALPLGMAIYD